MNLNISLYRGFIYTRKVNSINDKVIDSKFNIEYDYNNND